MAGQFGSGAAWMRVAAMLAAMLAAAMLVGCGGGGGGGDAISSAPGGTAGSGGSLPGGTASPDPAGPSASFAQQCAATNTLAASGLRTASLTTEKQWLRAYFDEAYLWRDEVPPVDPSLPSYSGADSYAAMAAYFQALKTPQLTGSGNRRDRFSFTYSTAQWRALADTGVEAGYGAEWTLASKLPPRRIRIAYVEPGSPAETAGLQRGDELLFVDDTSADAADAAGVDRLNAGLYPKSTGAVHRFVFRRSGTSDLTLSLTSASVTKTPVPLARVVTSPQGTRAGYLVFHDHSAPSEAPLIAALQGFQAQGVRELVLDLRYNGGGYLYIASELASMIAGNIRTAGRAFETLRYSPRRSGENTTTPFYTQSCIASGGSCTNTQPLPSLALTRVYLLAQPGTCSASESVINGLRGVGVNVVLIGGSTCGKPYGFTAKDNCGITYFPIEFSGVNAQGFGDYADGFEPTSGADTGSRLVTGCRVEDDFGRALGDPQEAMLASALGHLDSGRCPVLPGPAAGARAQSAPTTVNGEASVPLELQRHPARSNRLMRAR